MVLAQLSTSVSDDQIRLIIIALLVVAALLAALTTWYFVKTSPTRRVRAAQERRRAAEGRTGQRADGPPRTPPPGTAQQPVTGQPAPPARVHAEPSSADDEWERLTAPEPRRTTGG